MGAAAEDDAVVLGDADDLRRVLRGGKEGGAAQGSRVERNIMGKHATRDHWFWLLKRSEYARCEVARLQRRRCRLW